MDWFYEPQNAVYTYEILEEKLRTIFTKKCFTEYEWCNSERFFGSLQSAFSNFKRECTKDSFKKVRFIKYYFSNSDEENQRKIMLEMNTDLEVVSVDVKGILQNLILIFLQLLKECGSHFQHHSKEEIFYHMKEYHASHLS